MKIVKCHTCGYQQEFTDAEINQMYRKYQNGFIERGLPQYIYCGYCKSKNNDTSICEVYRKDD